MENSYSFCFDTMRTSQPENLKKENSKVRHSNTVIIEREASESYIEKFKIDNKFVIFGKSKNWVLIWDNSSDIFYQRSKNNKWQHLNFNAVKLSELGVGKFVIKKQKFTESDYTEFELTATRKPIGSSMKVMNMKKRPVLRLKNFIETRSVSVTDNFLEIENEITMEFWSSQESVFVQVKLVVYA